MIVAQISDLHVRRAGHVLHHMPNTASYVERAIDLLHAMDPRPTLVLATGDLTERGSPHEYRRLRTLLGRLEIPAFLLPGNHDRRDALRRAFADHAYLTTCATHASYAFDAWPLRVIALDSTYPSRAGGYVDDERLAWLDAELCEHPNRPTILALHHPPFRTGVRALDAHGFLNVERLGEIVRRNPQIARIICGHVHTAPMQPWNGTLACTAPSTSPQFVVGRSPLGIGLEAAGILTHEWTFDAALRTSVVRIDGRYAALIA